MPKENELDMAELAVDGLEAIALAVGGATATTAAGVLTVIKVILATLNEGFEGTVTPARVREELAKLTSNIIVNDQAADSALAAKFDRDGDTK